MSAYLKVIGSGDSPLQGPYTVPYVEFPPNRSPDPAQEAAPYL